MYYFIDIKFRTNLWCWISDYENMTKVWGRDVGWR